MILKDVTLGDRKLNGLHVIQSTGLTNKKDSKAQQIKFGVQIETLEDVVRDFHGKVWVRRLQCDRNLEFYYRLHYAHNIVHHRPCDLDPLDWLDALFDTQVENLQNNKTFFSSAL